MSVRGVEENCHHPSHLQLPLARPASVAPITTSPIVPFAFREGEP